jgi:hypothetical protein
MVALTIRGCAGIAVVAVLLVGCSKPDVTGLGAPKSSWGAHHSAQPATGAQPPPGYSSVVTDHAGRVEGYQLTVTPRPLAEVQRLVRADLPADARASAARGMVGVEGTMCEIVDFTSPALGRILGGPLGSDVMVVFQAEDPNKMDLNRIVTAVVVSGNEALPHQC